jgi:hypothetical protein
MVFCLWTRSWLHFKMVGDNICSNVWEANLVLVHAIELELLLL